MAAVLLALGSAFLFGAMTVALRVALRAHPEPDVGAVANHVCFWNEREDTVILVDGQRDEPLGTRENGDGGELMPPMRRFYAVPPPASMRGAGPGGRQHDFSRPNRRAEGPPEPVVDLAVEKAGGRPSDWAVL